MAEEIQQSGSAVLQLVPAYQGANQVKPLSFDPAKLKGLSEKLVTSHHQNNYGGAVRRLNQIQQQIGSLLFTLGALCLLAGPVSVRGEEVESLRATFEGEIAALNARDLEALMAAQHDNIVVLSPGSPVPLEGKDARRQSYQTLFATTERVTVTPVNPHYRVIGNTGVVWGEYTITTKPKEGEETTVAVRFTRTYVESGGNWSLVAYHLSPVPTKR